MKTIMSLFLAALTLVLFLWITDTIYAIQHNPTLAVIHGLIYGTVLVLIIIGIKKDLDDN